MTFTSKTGNDSGRVLITDGHWNKTVAAIRSLGRHGLKITAGESTRLAAGLFSRYVTRRIKYPAPLAAPGLFVDAVVAELERHDYDLLLPMELSTLLLLSQRRDRFASLVRFPFAPHATLLRAAGKKETLAAAKQSGIPAPKTVIVTPDTTKEELAGNPGLPLVLKPDFGEGGRGLYYCKNLADLEIALYKIKGHDQVYLAQEWLPSGGAALGVSMLMDGGSRVVASFTHRRLREYPVSGGPSTLRESCHHREAEEYARKLLAHIQWQGVAMVEFKVDPRDQVPKLMEINPRFWGSLPLAIKAGVDFPWLLYCLAKGESVARPEQVTGVKMRNIFPGDVLYFLAKRGKVGRGFFNCQNCSDDLLSFDDPGPVLGRLLSPLALLYDPQLRTVMHKRQDPKK